MRKYITPRVPNFIRVETVGADAMMPLPFFTDDELDDIAKKWRLALYERREQQKKNIERGKDPSYEDRP